MTPLVIERPAEAKDPDGQLVFPEVRPPVRIPQRYYICPEGEETWVAKPLSILGLCKEAALEADWSLRRWEEFSKTADACLRDPGAPRVEMVLFMRVVEERFHLK